MQSVHHRKHTKQGVSRAPSSSERCEEATLLQLARLGGYLGEQARSRLVVQHFDWIKSRCLRTLNEPADAHDAAQEAAVKMFHGLANFEGRSALRTWLGTIVHNECMNIMRKHQRAVLSEHVEALLEIHHQQLLSGPATSREGIGRVHRALDSIPAKNREVLLLRFFKELSLDEMSVTLDLSLSATKMRLYRAMQQFRDRFDETELAV